jgi:outer membrane protein assembly factor BamB
VGPTGDLFVAGAVSLQLGSVRLGQQDAVLLKIDKATGTPLWMASAGSPETDYPTALAFDAAGNVYMAGATLGAIAGGGPYHGDVDAFVVKFSPSGAVLGVWQRGTPGDDIIAGIAVDACGRVFVGGYTTGVLVPGQVNAGGRDMFLMQVDL